MVGEGEVFFVVVIEVEVFLGGGGGGSFLGLFFFFDFAPFEGEDDGDAGELVGEAELVDQILLVGFAHELGFVDEHDEAGWVGCDLREVVDA